MLQNYVESRLKAFEDMTKSLDNMTKDLDNKTKVSEITQNRMILS